MSGDAYKIVPINPSQHRQYKFYIKTSIQNGLWEYSPLYILNVGCTVMSTGTNNANLVVQKDVDIALSFDDMYAFEYPSMNLTDCTPERIEIVDVSSNYSGTGLTIGCDMLCN